jgi:hypothetical protein
MAVQAFQEKNEEDFDKNTEQLAAGIQAIASNSSLKPTVAELSRVTSLHRNTIRLRKWPLVRLAEIKETRRLEALSKRVKAKVKSDPVSVLEQRLEKSRLEVLHWFALYKDMESSFHTLDKRHASLLKSRDFYVTQSGERKKKISELELEILTLRRALEMMGQTHQEENS